MADLAVIKITFSGIPGERDVDVMTATLKALGYEVSADRDFSNAPQPGHPVYSNDQIVVDDYSKYRSKGTEDTGPAGPPHFNDPAQINDPAQGDQTI